MKSITHFLSKEKSLAWIIALGALARLLFVFVGGRFYYGNADYFFQGDTYSWFQSFINLVESGTFTINPEIDSGKFFRPPGYSFLFGIFYLVTFKNYVLAWKLLVTAQIIMDVVSIYLVAGISKSIFKDNSIGRNNLFSNVAALLYALYPSAIVFAPLLQAETSSIFFLLLSIWFAFKKVSYRNAFLSGIFGGIAILTRLQCAFGIPFIAIAFLVPALKKAGDRFKYAIVFCIAVAISYGLWPARNYLLHDRLIFSQDMHMGNHWSEDFISFLDFTHSISTDHTPYYWSILKNEKVNWPDAAYIDPGDSLLLDSVVSLCRTCSNGFAFWKHGEHLVPTLELPSQPCDDTIEGIFDSLTEKQKSRNAFHYWVIIPLQNLEKCFFKINLYGDKSLLVKLIANLFFITRSLLVLLGLIGIFIAFRKSLINRNFLLLASGFMISWYFFISFIHRNIEMRYLLHTDIILLIPATFTIMHFLFNKYLKQT